MKKNLWAAARPAGNSRSVLFPQFKCSLGIETRDGLGDVIIQIFSQLFFFPEKTALLFPKKFPNNGGWAYQLACVQPLAGGCIEAPDSFCGRAEV